MMKKTRKIRNYNSFQHKTSRLPPDFFEMDQIDAEIDEPQSFCANARKNFTSIVYQLKDEDTNLEGQANLIVQELEENEDLMEDSPESEQLRKEALRDMPQSLTMKRCVKVKLKKSVSRNSKRKPIGYWKSLKYTSSVKWNHLKTVLKNLVFSLELWYGTMKTIEGCFGSGVASYFRFFRWLFVLNIFVMGITFIFIVLPQIMYDKTITPLNPLNLMDGMGSLGNSLLYYGHYNNDSFYLTKDLPYKIPHAYFYTMVLVYFGCFAILSFSTAKYYKKQFIETKGGLKYVFANKIFCGWDFSIASKESARIKSAAIYNELKELINESLYETEEKSIWNKCGIFILQFFINLFGFITITTIGYGLWLLREHFKDNLPVIPSIINALIIIIYPLWNSLIVKLEKYKKTKNELSSTLLKTFLFYGVIIGVLVGQVLFNAPNTKCWENVMGEEVYRLIIYDFLLIIIFCLFETSLYIFGKRLEFNIGINTLQIIYNQALFWIGLWFSPLLPVIVVVKLLILWYCKSIILKQLCKPARKIWKANQMETYFLLMIFVAMLTIMAIFGYYFAKIPTSTQCGPFKNYNNVFDILTKDVIKIEERHLIWKLLLMLTKPGVIALILIFLAVRVYYLRIKSNVQRQKVEVVKEMLVWESKDREFLLNYIRKLSNKDHHQDSSQLLDSINVNSSMDDEYSDVEEDFSQYKKFN